MAVQFENGGDYLFDRFLCRSIVFVGKCRYNELTKTSEELMIVVFKVTAVSFV